MSDAKPNLREVALQRWRGFAPRERRGLAAALLVLAVFAVWSLFVQPAWRTLGAAPAQLDQLESELQRMQRLAAESKTLRNPVQISPGQAVMALKAATEQKAVSDALGDCTKHDGDCRVIAIGPFAVGPN